MESLLNDFPLCAPSDEEEGTVSWLNFPIAEPYNDEYCSELLPELGVAGNETDLASMERRSNSHHHVDDLARPSTSAKAPSMQQDNISKVLSRVTEQNKLKIGGNPPIMQSQYPLPRQPSNRSVAINFPHFSRLASLTATTAGAVISGKQKACDKSSCNPMEPTLVSSSLEETGSHVKLSIPPTVGSVASFNSKSDSLPPQQSGKNGKSIDQQFDAVPTEVMTGDERHREPVVATSSVCSGNRLESGSSDPACSLKRKCHETGDSEGPSDEAEDESVGDRKTSGRSGSKRGRAAEVHNLSERRRRERINEKMRALQELIPRCDKVDKASMLDEAIEYMKSLQLQLQILSMGTGMYMPPMMLPSAIQQMHRAHMPQFLPMGIGMGMHDANCSMTHMPTIQGPCYPVPAPPLGAVGHSHQFLGHPGQELYMPMPHIPPPLFGNPPIMLPVGNVSTMPATIGPLLPPSAASKEMNHQNVRSPKILNDQPKSSMNEYSDQATALLNDQYQDAEAAQNPGSTKPSRMARE